MNPTPEMGKGGQSYEGEPPQWPEESVGEEPGPSLKKPAGGIPDSGQDCERTDITVPRKNPFTSD